MQSAENSLSELSLIKAFFIITHSLPQERAVISAKTNPNILILNLIFKE